MQEREYILDTLLTPTCTDFFYNTETVYRVWHFIPGTPLRVRNRKKRDRYLIYVLSPDGRLRGWLVESSGSSM